jgi:hypothetical protein
MHTFIWQLHLYFNISNFSYAVSASTTRIIYSWELNDAFKVGARVHAYAVYTISHQKNLQKLNLRYSTFFLFLFFGGKKWIELYLDLLYQLWHIKYQTDKINHNIIGLAVYSSSKTSNFTTGVLKIVYHCLLFVQYELRGKVAT